MFAKSWKLVCCLSFVLALMVLAPGSAAAQPGTACDDNARAAFAASVDAGATEEELEAQFGHCRNAFSEPVCTAGTSPSTAKALTSRAGEPRNVVSQVKSFLNSNTYYERMNGCGYHPQGEMVACDVEIRQLWGYGGFPGGTNEYVRYCLDCNRDNIWDYTTLGFVHVTDNIAAGPVPSWYHLAYATTFAAPALCTNNDGQQTNVRAILSWAWVPPNCNSRPYWGNTINFTARRDP